jgi:hypothetical protein
MGIWVAAGGKCHDSNKYSQFAPNHYLFSAYRIPLDATTKYFDALLEQICHLYLILSYFILFYLIPIK